MNSKEGDRACLSVRMFHVESYSTDFDEI